MSDAPSFVDIAQARSFLSAYVGMGDAETDEVDMDLASVELAGEGAWSRCYGFRLGAEALVIRFGKHVDDFEKDQQACAHASPALPIPEVLDIGRAFDGYYAISRRVYGVPLEQADADAWRALVPGLAAALEAMRTADLGQTQGFGSWGADGAAPCRRWSEHLLAVAEDTPARRTHGWRARLAANPDADALFRRGYERLRRLVDDDIPRSLVHADLMNRNVLVDGARIAGVFDWGCSLYGDHLYDLAWFEFWAPWYPALDVESLRAALRRCWRDDGYVPANEQARLEACYLHIGLDHLAYNAYLGDWDALMASADRMQALVDLSQ